jgi:hypothetical protein
MPGAAVGPTPAPDAAWGQSLNADGQREQKNATVRWVSHTRQSPVTPTSL